MLLLQEHPPVPLGRPASVDSKSKTLPIFSSLDGNWSLSTTCRRSRRSMVWESAPSGVFWGECPILTFSRSKDRRYWLLHILVSRRAVRSTRRSTGSLGGSTGAIEASETMVLPNQCAPTARVNPEDGNTGCPVDHVKSQSAVLAKALTAVEEGLEVFDVPQRLEEPCSVGRPTLHFENWAARCLGPLHCTALSSGPSLASCCRTVPAWHSSEHRMGSSNHSLGAIGQAIEETRSVLAAQCSTASQHQRSHDRY